MVQGISFGITSQYISNYPRKDLRSQRMVDFCTTRGGAYDPIIHIDSFGLDYPRLKKNFLSAKRSSEISENGRRYDYGGNGNGATRGGAYDPIIHLITYIHCTLDSFGLDYPRLKKCIIKIINIDY